MVTMNLDGRLPLVLCVLLAFAPAGCGDEGGGDPDASAAVDAAAPSDSGMRADDAGTLADAGSSTDDGGPASDAGASTDGGGGGSDAGNRADAGSTLPEFCGGLIGARCPDTHYCDYPDLAMCGFADGTGTCEPRPEICTDDCPGVCGCDGNTYCNRCGAAAMGIDTLSDGPCSSDG